MIPRALNQRRRWFSVTMQLAPDAFDPPDTQFYGLSALSSGIMITFIVDIKWPYLQHTSESNKIPFIQFPYIQFPF